MRRFLPFLALLAGCASRQAGGDVRTLQLGSYARPVSTRSAEARDFVHRGLALVWGFQRDEGAEAFRLAAKADPNCALAWWGIAHALGNDINFTTIEAGPAGEARAALDRALAALPYASEVERAIVRAEDVRHVSPPPQDRKELDQAFAAAMKDVYGKFPDDADVGTLYAESLMNLRPWDFWKSDGTPHPGTEDVIAALDRVLARTPHHPGANHLYIHILEASPFPERALAAADRLRSLVPDTAHLLHMPAHIDVRVGQWDKGAVANERAIEADARYTARRGPDAQYHVYRAHNAHFLAWISMMEGRYGRAMEKARELVAGFPAEASGELLGFVDYLTLLPVHVQLRFGRYEDILEEPQPAEQLKLSRAMWHEARGVAAAVLGKPEVAERELAAFEAAAAQIPEDAKVGIHKARDIAQIGRKLLEGELRFRQGRTDEGLAKLREGVLAEEALNYDEPPGWLMPVRHALGALLLESGKVEEAEAVYREDLKRNRENGWALRGLLECCERLNRDDLESVRARFNKAWARADTELRASCFCRAGARGSNP